MPPAGRERGEAPAALGGKRDAGGEGLSAAGGGRGRARRVRRKRAAGERGAEAAEAAAAAVRLVDEAYVRRLRRRHIAADGRRARRAHADTGV